MSAQTENTREQAGLELEYNALRNELLKRIELRNQMVLTTLTLAGVVFSFGLTSPTIAFVFPIIAAFLVFAWMQHDARVRELGEYIRDNIEPKIPGLGWDTYRKQRARKLTRLGNMRLSVLSASGVFFVIQFVALFIGFSKVDAFTRTDWIFGIIAVLFTVLTLAVLIGSRTRDRA